MRLRFAACAFGFLTLLSASTFAQEQETPSRPPEVGPLLKPAPQRIRLGANAAAAALVHQVTPKYPKDAKAAHICGTVLLHAIIAKDGAVQQLEYISGPRLLSKSAMDAVRQWHYRPMLLDGQRIEVDTKISVVYTLGKSCDGSSEDNAPEKKSLLVEPAFGPGDH
jgi:TonB family protein